MPTWLSPRGAAVAALVGTAVAVGAGWRGFVLLLVFFVSSSALTRGGGRRTPVQVWANGGIAALAALLAPLLPAGGVALAGALSAATADTWSTELGGRSGHAPRLLTTGRVVPAGTSGGVTWLGSLGGLAGAALIGASSAALGLVGARGALLVTAAGIVGGLADSLLGATLQARFRCPACGAVGEVAECRCGARRRATSGVRWLSNDVVNVACTTVGAAVAAAPSVLGTW
jgi:uncharacterized protein (TIGR00297 family)